MRSRQIIDEHFAQLLPHLDAISSALIDPMVRRRLTPQRLFVLVVLCYSEPDERTKAMICAKAKVMDLPFHLRSLRHRGPVHAVLKALRRCRLIESERSSSLLNLYHPVSEVEEIFHRYSSEDIDTDGSEEA